MTHSIHLCGPCEGVVVKREGAAITVYAPDGRTRRTINYASPADAYGKERGIADEEYARCE